MDTDVLELLAAPFVASLVLSSIHTYLGIHVVERGVIFVDLALAQVAALGTTFGFLMGASLHDGGAHWWSLGFTFVGAAIFTLTRTRRTSIPQEALIGIVYAVSAALSHRGCESGSRRRRAYQRHARRQYPGGFVGRYPGYCDTLRHRGAVPLDLPEIISPALFRSGTRVCRGHVRSKVGFSFLYLVRSGSHLCRGNCGRASRIHLSYRPICLCHDVF